LTDTFLNEYLAGMKRLLVLGAVLVCSTAHSAPTLCYIPGAGGGNDYVLRHLPRDLEARNIKALSFDVGKNDTVEFHSRKFVSILQTELNKDPTLKCHILGYSMGGLMARYALNHLSVTLEGVQKPVLDVVLSLSTFSTPHTGTPLPRLWKQFFGTIDGGRDELSEDNVVKFNDPTNADTYSPLRSEIPNYSVTTQMTSSSQAQTLAEQFGFKAIQKDYESRGIEDTRNDGIVPTRAMKWGRLIAELKVPHSYFGKRVNATPALDEYFEHYWAFLNAGADQEKEILKLQDLSRQAVQNR
jgi:hypothetical protein